MALNHNATISARKTTSAPPPHSVVHLKHKENTVIKKVQLIISRTLHRISAHAILCSIQQRLFIFYEPVN